MSSRASLYAMAMLMAGLVLLSASVSAVPGDVDNDGVSDDKEIELAERYAPVLYFAPGEQFYPVSPEYHISRSDLKRGADAVLVDGHPTVAELAGYTNESDEYYLDNRMGTIEDTGIARDFEASKDSVTATVHARVTDVFSAEGELVVVQYWFFYPFNNGPLNNHEGDWEMITLVLDAGYHPLFAGYSQHHAGEWAHWQDVDKEGTHPKVYVALGAHANYLRPYEGRLSIASDTVSDAGRVLKNYDIVLLGERGTDNHDPGQGWLEFAGYWGDYGAALSGARGERGPLGPMFFDGGERWNDPVAWARGLSQADSNWFSMNWVVSNFVLLVLLSMVIGLVVRVALILKKRRTTGLGPRLIPFLYIDGVNAKSVGLILGIAALVITIAAMFMPWYSVVLDVNSPLFSTGGPVEIITIDGINGFSIRTIGSGEGVSQVAALPIPFAWIFLAGIGLFLLGTVGVQKSYKFGKKLAMRGVRTMVPVIMILVVVILLGIVISSLVQGTPREIRGIVETIGSNPVGGEVAEDYGDWGAARLSWGLGTGSYMFIAAAILLFIAGILEYRAYCHYFVGKDEAEGEPVGLEATEDMAGGGYGDYGPYPEEGPGAYPQDGYDDYGALGGEYEPGYAQDAAPQGPPPPPPAEEVPEYMEESDMGPPPPPPEVDEDQEPPPPPPPPGEQADGEDEEYA